MGLTIHYTVRVRSEAKVAPLLEGAIAAAKEQGWKVRRRKATDRAAAFVPHPRSEDVVLDFTDGLVMEGFVKTSSAPLETHIAIVEFFDAIKPLCSSIKLDDETGYAKSRSIETLKRARDEFDAVARGSTDSGQPPVFFTGIIGHADGTFEITDEMKSRMTAKELKKLESELAEFAEQRKAWRK